MSSVLLLTITGSATAAMRYVWQGSPSPTPPYTNWTTAAHVIQDAVDAAIPGDTVLVTNGVCTVSRVFPLLSRLTFAGVCCRTTVNEARYASFQRETRDTAQALPWAGSEGGG